MNRESRDDDRESLDDCRQLNGFTSESRDWSPDHASKYDYCAVFEIKDGADIDQKAKKLITKLIATGLETFSYRSENFVFVLIRAPTDMLRNFAHYIEYSMLLDRNALEKLALTGIPEKHIGPLSILDDPEVCTLNPYELIYAPYSKNVSEALYDRPFGMSHPFSEIHRLKLTKAIIESQRFRKDPVKIRKYIIKKIMLGFFPLHNRRDLDFFRRSWLPWKVLPWALPVEAIKNYFGEKIGLYFSFLGHFSLWLRFPAIIGLPIQIYVLAVNDFSSPVLPFFSVLIVLWAIVMLEFWKRKVKCMFVFCLPYP
jgi:hypothetical protein